jgi:hypothetical protein
MLRKASFLYPSDVYALSFEKYKGQNLAINPELQISCVFAFFTL